MNYLELAQSYARLADPESVDQHVGSITAIGVVMETLTFGLLLSFGGVAFKKAYLSLRSTSMNDVRARVRSFGRSGDGLGALAEVQRIGTTFINQYKKAKARMKSSSASKRAVEMPPLNSRPQDRQLSAGANAQKLPKPRAAPIDPAGIQSSDEPSSSLGDATREADSSDWKVVVDPATGQTYYHNVVTNETSWSLFEP